MVSLVKVGFIAIIVVVSLFTNLIGFSIITNMSLIPSIFGVVGFLFCDIYAALVIIDIYNL